MCQENMEARPFGYHQTTNFQFVEHLREVDCNSMRRPRVYVRLWVSLFDLRAFARSLVIRITSLVLICCGRILPLLCSRLITTGPEFSYSYVNFNRRDTTMFIPPLPPKILSRIVVCNYSKMSTNSNHPWLIRVVSSPLVSESDKDNLVQDYSNKIDNTLQRGK